MKPTSAKLLNIASLILGLALFPVISAHSQSLADCAAIEDPDQRLSCFDDLANSVPAPASAPAPAPTPIPAPAIVPQATVSPAASGSSAAAATDSAATPQATTSTAGVSSYQDLFGLENEAANKGITEVQSRIVDDFNGWSGKTVFRLENGQVWVQYDQNSKLSWRGDAHPMAIVKRKSFNSYMLGVEGSNKMVRVKRIQ